MEMGHTSEMAHQAMIEELEKLFEGKEYSGQEGPKSLKIFTQFEPIPTDNDEDTDTDAANCPCIICKLLSGNFAATGEAQLLFFQLVIAAYDRNTDRQGYLDVVNIKEDITQHFLANQVFGGSFVVQYPMAWAIQEESTVPFYWGVVNFYVSAPARKNTQVEDLI